jgi:hypothetical protein
VIRKIERFRPELQVIALGECERFGQREYVTVVAVTKGGQTLRGIALNEDDLRSVRRERRSIMPSYADRLTAAEIGDLVSYRCRPCRIFCQL